MSKAIAAKHLSPQPANGSNILVALKYKYNREATVIGNCPGACLRKVNLENKSPWPGLYFFKIFSLSLFQKS